MLKKEILKAHINEIREMRSNGVSNGDIADHFDVSLCTLTNFLSENGFVTRVKFTKATSDNKSKGASVEFSTTSVEATVFPLSEAINGLPAGTWEKHKTFSSLTDAESYLNGLLTPSNGSV